MVPVVDDRQLVALKLLAYHFSGVADEQSASLVDEVLEDYVENAVVAGDLQKGNDFKRGKLELLQFILHG